jgi:preprotein translocase subunit SecA
VGTISIEDSEHLSKLLEKKKIPHNVLNAKHHEKEAEIIAQAGRSGAVTISTNMAGRGTDILLGGNPEYLAKEILRKKGKIPEEATQEEWKQALEEAYRITAGRQGDLGESRFILSLEDDLLRLFGGDRVKKMMEFLKIPEGEPIESRIVTKAIENAQKRIEAQNFQIRKRLLEYDDVANIQRQAIYSMRRDLLEGKDLEEYLKKWTEDLLNQKIAELLPEEEPELWDLKPLQDYLRELTGRDIDIPKVRDKEELLEVLVSEVLKILEEKKEQWGEALFREIFKTIALSNLDHLWREHIHILERLKEGIYLRGYAARDPLVEYKKEAFLLFENMLFSLKERVLQDMIRVQIASQEEVEEQVRKEEEERERLLKSAVFSGVEGKADKPKRKTLKERLKEKRKSI